MNKDDTKMNVHDSYKTLLVVILTALMTTFSGSALNLSIPAIDNEYGAGAVLIGWVINGYILAGAALSVPFGRLADITGRERILKIGILIFSLSAGAICFGRTIGIFLLFRILQGIGGAMIFATNQAVLISSYPPEKRGKVLGYLIGATYIGLTTGPVVGGILNHSFGWRSIMILTFVIGAGSFILALKELPKTSVTKNSNQTMDYLGSILYILIIVSMMYGLSSFSTKAYAKYLILVSIGLFIIFLRHELRVKSPVIHVGLFKKNISYLLSNLAALLNYGATFAVGYLMSIYLQVVRGFDSNAAGLVLISQPLIMALLSPYAGRLSDRISPHKLASFGMGLCALGLFLFAFITELHPLPLIIINLFIVGLGFAFFSSPNTNAVMACVEPKDYGVASSILATMRNLGQSSNMAVVTFIVSIFLGSTPLNDADVSLIIKIMRISFMLFTGLCIV
ncbi:MAG TPA: MFS transporter, partial [Anaerovoracaceae bacterium]|nr:MFS transporter [Anaerovoracaceae bacterium]